MIRPPQPLRRSRRVLSCRSSRSRSAPAGGVTSGRAGPTLQLPRSATDELGGKQRGQLEPRTKAGHLRQDRTVSYGTWTALGVSVGSLAVSVAAFARTGRWRAMERREAIPRFEVMATPMYTLGMQGRGVLARVNVIAQNTSSADVTISQLGIEVVGFSTPKRVFGEMESFPRTVRGRSPLYFTVPAIAFPELLGLISGASGEQKFRVFIQAGHGTTAQRWTSVPFSVAPVPPNPGGYSEWSG